METFQRDAIMQDTTAAMNTTSTSLNKAPFDSHSLRSDKVELCGPPSSKLKMTDIPTSSSSTVSIGSIEHSRVREAELAGNDSDAQCSSKQTPEDIYTEAITVGRQFLREGSYQDAVQSFREALLIKNKTIPFESPSDQVVYASVLFDVGMIHAHTQYHEPLKALQSFDICLELSRVCLGPEHPSIATILYEIGTVYEAMDEPAEALALFLDAIAILHFHPAGGQIRKVWKSLARVLASLGKTQEGDSCLIEAGMP